MKMSPAETRHSLLASARRRALAHRRECRLEAGSADDRRHHPVGRPAGRFDERVGTGRPRCRCRRAGPKLRVAGLVADDRKPAPMRTACSARPATLLLPVSATTRRYRGCGRRGPACSCRSSRWRRARRERRAAHLRVALTVGAERRCPVGAAPSPDSRRAPDRRIEQREMRRRRPPREAVHTVQEAAVAGD